MLAAIAAITMIVGNAGALGQSSLKRMLGYSGVGQAGYMLCGVVVGSRLGVQATVLYLMGYLAMNMAAFAVIVAAQHERPDGDDVTALAGLGARQPWLAWPMTVAMLALAGIPGTVGFIGKFQLIHALVGGVLHVAGDRARDRLDDLARLLPAGGGRDLDARPPRHSPARVSGGSGARARGRGWSGGRRSRAGSQEADEPPRPRAP